MFIEICIGSPSSPFVLEGCAERGAAGVQLRNYRSPTRGQFDSRKPFLGAGEVSLGKGGVVIIGGRGFGCVEAFVCATRIRNG